MTRQNGRQDAGGRQTAISGPVPALPPAVTRKVRAAFLAGAEEPRDRMGSLPHEVERVQGRRDPDAREDALSTLLLKRLEAVSDLVDRTGGVVSRAYFDADLARHGTPSLKD